MSYNIPPPLPRPHNQKVGAVYDPWEERYRSNIGGRWMFSAAQCRTLARHVNRGVPYSALVLALLRMGYLRVSRDLLRRYVKRGRQLLAYEEITS